MPGRRPLPLSVRFNNRTRPVVRVGAAFEEPRSLHAIDMTRNSDRLHIQESRELRLVDPLVVRQTPENLQLRRGHIEMPHLLIEAAA